MSAISGLGLGSGAQDYSGQRGSFFNMVPIGSDEAGSPLLEGQEDEEEQEVEEIEPENLRSSKRRRVEEELGEQELAVVQNQPTSIAPKKISVFIRLQKSIHPITDEMTFSKVDIRSHLLPFLNRSDIAVLVKCSPSESSHIRHKAEKEIREYEESLLRTPVKKENPEDEQTFLEHFSEDKRRDIQLKITKLKDFVATNAGKDQVLPKSKKSRNNFKRKTFLYIATSKERESILNDEICPLLQKPFNSDNALKAIPAIVTKLFGWSKAKVTLEHVSKKLKKDDFVVQAAISALGPEQFQFARKKFKKNRGYILEIIKTAPDCLKFVEPDLKKDPEFALEMIEKNYRVFGHLDEELRKKKTFILRALQINGLLLSQIPSTDRNEDVVLEACRQNVNALASARPTLLSNEAFMLKAMNVNIKSIRFSMVQNAGFIIQCAKIILKQRNAAILKNKQKIKELDLFENKYFITLAAKSEEIDLLKNNEQMEVLDKEQKLSLLIEKLAKWKKHNKGILLQSRNAIKILKEEPQVDLLQTLGVTKNTTNSPFEYILLPKFFLECIKRFPKEDLGIFPPQLVRRVHRATNDFIYSVSRMPFPNPFLYASPQLRENANLVRGIVKENPIAIKDLESTLINAAFFLELIAENPEVFKYAEKYIMEDPEFIHEALQINLGVCRFIPDKFKTDINKNKEVWEFYYQLISYDGILLKYVPSGLAMKKDFVLHACNKNGLALEFAPEVLKKDVDCIRAAIANNAQAINIISKQFIYTLEFVTEIITKYRIPLSAIPVIYRQNKNIVNLAIKNDFNELEFASASLRNDKAFMLEAAKSNREAIQYASDLLKEDPDFFLKAVAIDWRVLKYASEPFIKENKKFFLEAIKIDVRALDFAAKSILENRAFFSQAIKVIGKALRFAHENVKANVGFMKTVIAENYSMLKHASESLHGNPEFMFEAYKINKKTIKFVSSNLENNKQFILMLVKHDGMALQYAGTTLRNDIEVIKSAINQNKKAISFVSPTIIESSELYEFIQESEDSSFALEHLVGASKFIPMPAVLLNADWDDLDDLDDQKKGNRLS
ncbi:MAG: DUF4116 domain-containing protein [Parachlamydiaceae bacterium]|nr:DUF4116 domain-containing protein [Parachlamydiaceae bacterium]